MKTSKALDYVCIFTGGSIRGAAYVGVLRAMEELGINNKCLVGSSVGAIISTLYATGCTPNELEEQVNTVNFELFKDINFTFSKEFSLCKGEYFLERLREIIEKNYYGDKYVKGENSPITFKDLKTDLVIIATDLTATEVKVFSKETTPDFEVALATRISASMPGLMKPIVQDNHILIDGDVSRSWPIWKLFPSLLNYDARILEYRLEGGKNRQKLDNTLDFINSIYTAFSNFAADYVISTYKDRDKFDYIRLDTDEINVTDFNLSTEKKKELYNIGYNTTIDFFTNDLPKKRAKILPYYKEIYSKICTIKNCIEQSKYITAKNKLTELFVHMSKAKVFIEKEFYDEILDFYEKYTKKLINTFGLITILKDKTQCLKEIEQIELNLNSKIQEIEEFINTASKARL